MQVAYQDPVFARLFVLPAALQALASLGFEHPKFWSAFMLSKPPHGTFAQPWFASIGADVWRIDAGQAPAAQRLPAPAADDGDAIIALAGYEAADRAVCYACTGRRLYELRAGAEWAPLHDFEDAPALGFALAPGFPVLRGAYVLRLGGTLCRLELP